MKFVASVVLFLILGVNGSLARASDCDRMLSFSLLEGEAALNFMELILPTGRLAVNDLPQVNFNDYPPSESLAPGATEVEFEFVSGKVLTLRWYREGEPIAKLKFPADFNLPAELAGNNDPGGDFIVDLWVDTSHRLYYSARHIQFVFSASNHLKKIQVDRFHRSDDVAKALSVAHTITKR